ncbi:MAG: proteasome-activating nucleotidase, partial [Desulfurococcaceae archaeon]
MIAISNQSIEDSSLDEYIKSLEERVRILEDERRRLEIKLNYYRSEIEKLLSSPLIEAVVVKVIDSNRVIVKSSTGPNLIVNVIDSIPLDKLKPGQHVALNQRGSTIVSILPEYTDPYVSSMEVIEKPDVTYSDIGG